MGRLFRKLRTRYYVAVVGIATVPLLAFGIFASLRSANELERQSLVLQNEMAIRVEREIASFLSARINELRLLEQANVLYGVDQRQLAASLGRLLAHGQVYQDLFVLTPAGQVRAVVSRTNVVPQEAGHLRQEPFAQPGYWAENTVYVGPVEFDAVLREPLVHVAVPITERLTGEVTGILVAHARFRPIWVLLADLDLPGDTEALVVNAEGRILAHPSAAEVLSARVFDVPPQGGRYVHADGRTALVAKRKLSLVSEPVHVIVSRPLSSALASAFEIRTTLLFSAALLLAAASALALWQARDIVRPVEQLARRARLISGGDLETSINVVGPEEITALGRTLEEMRGQLRETIGSLKRSEFAERERAMVTLQSIGDAVITTDPKGRITYVNAVAERLTGWSQAEAMDLPLAQVFAILNSATREPARDPVARCLETNSIVALSSHTILLSRDGTEYAISDTAAPIRESDGNILGVVLVFQDVTEQRSIEHKLRESQKMEAIGKLSGGIAHDFNNLLQVIQGNAELLAEDASQDSELIAPILRAAKRGAELSQRLLAYARKQPLQTRTVDLRILLADILPILDRTLGGTITVSLDIPNAIWRVLTDPSQLETALLNLGVNARDAMPEGGSLTIRCENATQRDFHEDHEAELEETDFVLISITDTGEGMSAETQRRATDPFFTTKRVGEGSGLGLSMVYGFVMQTGGHLEIESAEGAGTKVKIFLPRSRADAGLQHADEQPEPVRGSGESILLVEDDAEVRSFARRTLQGLGYRVVDVGTVNAAHRALAGAQAFDLVLSDVVLPGGASGLDLAQELRRTHPGLPVVLMSGYPNLVAERESGAAERFVLLNKPFQRAQLAEAVRNAFEHQLG